MISFNSSNGCDSPSLGCPSLVVPCQSGSSLSSLPPQDFAFGRVRINDWSNCISREEKDLLLLGIERELISARTAKLARGALEATERSTGNQRAVSRVASADTRLHRAENRDGGVRRGRKPSSSLTQTGRNQSLSATMVQTFEGSLTRNHSDSNLQQSLTGEELSLAPSPYRVLLPDPANVDDATSLFAHPINRGPGTFFNGMEPQWSSPYELPNNPQGSSPAHDSSPLVSAKDLIAESAIERSSPSESLVNHKVTDGCGRYKKSRFHLSADDADILFRAMVATAKTLSKKTDRWDWAAIHKTFCRLKPETKHVPVCLRHFYYLSRRSHERGSTEGVSNELGRLMKSREHGYVLTEGSKK